jgi:xeroderma pigmentosum group C-complementing protein
VEKDEDEDDIDLQSSGSDFEEELRKETFSGRKRKSIGTTAESESSDDDDDEEEDDDSSRAARKPKKRISRKSGSATPDHNSNSKRKSFFARNSNTPSGPPTNGVTKKDEIDVPNPSFLSLSESSESDNDDRVVAKAAPDAKHSDQTASGKAKLSAPKKADFSQEFAFTQLQALARDHEDEDDHQPWVRKTSSSHSSPVKRKDLHLEASELMALVEEPQSEESDSADDEDEQPEVAPEIKTELASTSSAAIEVTVPLFDQNKRKKKLTEEDVAAKLKRQMDRFRREQQVALHKAHVVCLVAHVRHANAALSQTLVLAAALSVVPQAHAVATKSLTVTKLGQMLSWFKEAFRSKSRSQELR